VSHSTVVWLRDERESGSSCEFVTNSVDDENEKRLRK
jgi:hypothetical protein